MIDYLDRQGKNRSERLWKQAFPEDSDSFDQYYFAEKMKDNRVLALTEEGEILSMAHLNPYQVRMGSEVRRVDYIVGVATDQDRRHRGYMRRVLTRMMQDMYGEGMPFCFLMPADERIYLPFDFTYIFDQPEFRLKDAGGLKEVPVRESGVSLEALGDWMNRWLEERFEVFCVRDRAYVELLLKELASEDGTLTLLYHEGRLAGVRGEWGIGKKEQRLLYCEDGFAETKDSPKPAIMARIICLEQFIRTIRLADDSGEESLTVKLSVKDGFLSQNQGSYLWNLKKDGSELQKISREPDAFGPDEAVVMDISRLTAWLFGYRTETEREWMSKVRTLKGVFLDEVV